jgi:hypothetical protein
MFTNIIGALTRGVLTRDAKGITFNYASIFTDITRIFSRITNITGALTRGVLT